MKKILLVSIILLAVFSVGVYAAEFPVLENQVQARISHLEWKQQYRKQT